MKYGFGIDVGGTTIKMGLLDDTGTLIEKREIPTHIQNNGRSNSAGNCGRISDGSEEKP